MRSYRPELGVFESQLGGQRIKQLLSSKFSIVDLTRLYRAEIVRGVFRLFQEFNYWPTEQTKVHPNDRILEQNKLVRFIGLWSRFYTIGKAIRSIENSYRERESYLYAESRKWYVYSVRFIRIQRLFEQFRNFEVRVKPRRPVECP